MTRRSGISQEELRRRNTSALLTRVHLSGPTRRADLTAELGLNRSTVGDLTALLGEAGLVREEASAVAARGSGRPSHLVAPRHDVCVVAVALEVDRLTVALVGLGGAVLDRRTRIHQPAAHDVGLVVANIAEMAHEVMTAEHRVIGVGVSVPGAVRQTDGLVRFAPNLGWRDEPFTALLADALELPVVTENESDLGALSEHLRGAAIGINDVAYLHGRVGLGGGFLINGQPMRGAQGYAGEIGHQLVDSQGERCRCGSFGCWETKVGDNHLLTLAGRLLGGGAAAVDEVIAAAQSGDPRARAAVDEVATWTGVGLRTVVNLFNPGVIVLAGMLAQIWGVREKQVRESLAHGTVIAEIDRLAIKPAKLGDDSTLIGAAEVAFAPLLDDPVRYLGG